MKVPSPNESANENRVKKKGERVDIGLNVSMVVMSTLEDAVKLSPIPGLSGAAGAAVTIIAIVQVSWYVGRFLRVVSSKTLRKHEAIKTVSKDSPKIPLNWCMQLSAPIRMSPAQKMCPPTLPKISNNL